MRTESEGAIRQWPGDDWALSVDGLTVQRALVEVGLRAPARFYPEWVCAEAFLLMLLRVGVRLPSATVYRRAAAVGLRRVAVQRAGARLGVIATRQRGVGAVGWTWSLPAELATGVGCEAIQRRWRRWCGG